MRRKGKKVVKPAGSELMDYLNKGYAICNKCGAVMDRKEDPEGGCDIYACPSCGWEIEELDYDELFRNRMSTRAQTKWNSDSMKEATSI